MPRARPITPGEVYPSTKAPALLEAHGDVKPDLLYWGFQTLQALVISTRSETAGQISLFRDSLYGRIYQQWNGKNCYCILITEANGSMVEAHPRMPVVPTPELMTVEDNQTALWQKNS